MNTLTFDKITFKTFKSATEPFYIKIDNEIIGHFTPLSDFDPEEDTPEQHQIWAEKSLHAEKKGFIGVEASKALMDKFRNA